MLFTQLRGRGLSRCFPPLCRLLLFHGDLGECRDFFGYLVDLLVKASKYDHRLHDLYACLNRSDEPSHPHGYGYFIALTYGDVIEHMYYNRSHKPIYLDKHGVYMAKYILDHWEHDVYGLLHTRKASTGEPIGILHTHPFMVRDGVRLAVLVHNGSFDKARLCMAIGINESICNSISDSYVATLYIGYRLRDVGDPINVLSELLDEYVGYDKASIVGLAYIVEGRIKLYYGVNIRYDCHSPCGEMYRRYYEPYIIRYRDCIALVSSTIHDLLVTNTSYRESITVHKLPYNTIGEL